MKPIFSLLILAPLLTSCAVMSEKQCLHADWRSVGYLDGINGKTLALLSERADACAKHGIALNRNDYLAGRDNGLDRFCTYENGLRFGESSSDYLGQCVNRDEDTFMAGYHIGTTTYKLRSAADRLSSRIETLNNRIEILNEKLNATIESCRDQEKPFRVDTKEHNIKTIEKLKQCQKIAKYTERERSDFKEKLVSLNNERSFLHLEYHQALKKLSTHKASY